MEIFVGVDPAFRKNGHTLAILYKAENTSRKMLELKKFKLFKDFIFWIFQYGNQVDKVCIENSYLQNATFDDNPKDSRKVYGKKSRDVGKNQAASQITYQLFCDFCKSTHQRSAKSKGAKWTSDKFVYQILSGLNIHCDQMEFDQDERDAIKMLTMIL